MTKTMTGKWAKSTYSNSFSNCLEARWQKSSHSTWNGNCLEARHGGVVQVRDSKLGGDGPVLEFTPAAWQAFADGLKT